MDRSNICFLSDKSLTSVSDVTRDVHASTQNTLCHIMQPAFASLVWLARPSRKRPKAYIRGGIIIVHLIYTHSTLILAVDIYVCMHVFESMFVRTLCYMCVHAYCIGMLLCIHRYYQQFPIDQATGESNLTQLYIQVSSTIAVSRYCVNVPVEVEQQSVHCVGT